LVEAFQQGLIKVHTMDSQTHGLADSQTHTRNENCFDPNWHGMYN